METIPGNINSSLLSLIADKEKELRSLWLNDTARPWSVYSKEAFCRFWDIRTVEHRK